MRLCEKETQNVTPPPAECVYFTSSKKAPRTPTYPDYHESALDECGIPPSVALMPR